MLDDTKRLSQNLKDKATLSTSRRAFLAGGRLALGAAVGFALMGSTSTKASASSWWGSWWWGGSHGGHNGHEHGGHNDHEHGGHNGNGGYGGGGATVHCFLAGTRI
ncbi:MAG: hypothetical protein P8Y36_10455, partial [Alphaproteobacteria bacterium]